MSDEPVYHLVYDAAQVSLLGLLPQLIFPLVIGAIMISIGIVYVVRPDALMRRAPATRFGRQVRRGFSIFWLLSVCILFALALGSILINSTTFAAASREGTCQRVEGVVTGFKEGKGVRFVVDGVPFDYSNASLTGAYNDSGWFSSPVQPGMRVRICYVGKGPGGSNVIVRLEIAGLR